MTRGRWAWRALSLVLLGASIWFLNRTMGPEGWRLLGERFRSITPAWFLAVLLTHLGVYVVWATRWRLVLRAVAHVPWWPALRALMASVFVNTVVPFARSIGGLVRATALGRARGLPVAGLYGPTLVDQIAYSTVSVSLGAFAVPFAIWSGGSKPGRTIAGITLALAGAAIVGYVLKQRRDRILGWVRRRAPGAAQAVELTVASAGRVLARPSSYPVLVLGGAAVWALNVLTFFCAGRAVGAGFGFGGAAAAWSFGSVAGVASGTPGGVGTTESVALVPLIAAGVPASEALAAILLARLVQYGAAIAIGGICFLGAGAGVPTGASTALTSRSTEEP